MKNNMCDLLNKLNAKVFLYSLAPSSLILVLLSIMFPVGVLAAWSSPGEDFNGELTVGGAVTSSRNPWTWKLMAGENELALSTDEGLNRNGEMIWGGLLGARSILLGKTTHVSPTGRDGLAPRVNYAIDIPGASLVWLADGMSEISLPVYDKAMSSTPVGQFNFRLRAAMMLRSMAGENPYYTGVYNDLTGNGLPTKDMGLDEDKTTALLCVLFAGEGPKWLCNPSTTLTGSVPLSRLTESSFHQIEGVYGAHIIGGSGELRFRKGAIPERWKSTLSVSIEYQ
ncbi:fimbrial protein [Salmonella enterica]|nr:fimbrial protein [Salmonella enterica]EAQ0971136.1 fimbrial protein [Salmonella enterica]EAT6281946.1 fimbrial protein [Salmonella enterica]EBA8767057.1 fimbrial protein [Salmonella enterica]EBO6747539.1 fimbrial protein [Salmonella enterica]